MSRLLILSALVFLASCGPTPPFGGTVYTEADILTDQDPSLLRGFSFVRMETSTQWDNRVNDDITTEFYRFAASYPGGQSVAFLVNGEYVDQAQARYAGRNYAFVLGQMPAILRKPVRKVVVHETGGDWSASPGEITIQDGFYEDEAADGALEESMIHETVHTSIDPIWEDTDAWKNAQRADGAFISTYGRDNPDSEDLAESFTLYLGLALNPERMPAELVATMQAVMPARLAFFRKYFPRPQLGL